VIAIYPQEIWYTYVDKSDIDEIIDEHLVHGRIVERLRIWDLQHRAGYRLTGLRANSRSSPMIPERRAAAWLW
jgi:hypothetical protein